MNPIRSSTTVHQTLELNHVCRDLHIDEMTEVIALVNLFQISHALTVDVARLILAHLFDPDLLGLWF